MKVAIVEPVGGHGGMNYYDFGLASGLVKAGADVTIYTCDETVVPAQADFVCRRYFKRIYGGSNKLLRGLRYVAGLGKSLVHARIESTEVCHFHFFHFTVIEYISVLCAKFFGFKVVVTVHDVESFSGDSTVKFANKVLSYADKIVVHNLVSNKELSERVGVQSDVVAVIPHGNYLPFIDTAVESDNARRHLGLDLDVPVLLFFGQIKEVKGLDLLISAMPRIVEKHPGAVLLVAGKVWKDDFGKYLEIIKNLGVEDSVKLDIRYIPDKEAKFYYAAADLIVLPYRKIYQSGVLLMAMSYRRAVVTSDLDGMCEVVSDGDTGFVFETGSSSSLSSVVVSVLNDRSSLQRVAKAGFDLMRNDYSWDAIGKRTFDAYREVIRG